ncbi:DUF2784 domain-containing protein [Marinoscillum sp. MHG1-6]|uniref:DUF2784 domain-containing protein n=1 Tax=Marinoscillum sp. MHG1-6 TaxID=2959627 RepID=UPI0021578F7F|nr:DUF2784 domain-containing protein [Marinoscillum sp. MHG1-6]
MIFLDYFLTIFHSLFILFVLAGWAFPQTRKVHLLALILVLAAWVVLGFFIGTWGYCPLTDWHWDIKRSLGQGDLPSSFVEYILEQLFRTDLPSGWVDIGTVAGLVFSIAMAAYQNTIRK